MTMLSRRHAHAPGAVLCSSLYSSVIAFKLYNKTSAYGTEACSLSFKHLLEIIAMPSDLIAVSLAAIMVLRVLRKRTPLGS